jgi:hypothetical protein
LLLEPSRTNELQFSEQADNAYYTKEGATISANTTATLDPSGYNGADKLEEDSSTGVHRYGKGTFASGTQRTFSVFAKKGERNFVSLFENNSVNPQVKGVIFNLNTGALSLNNDPSFYLNPTIVDYGNGWYRCSATWTPASLSVPSVGVSADGLTNSYTGTTGSGIYVWGAQLEAGAYATSYIPTLSTSVTRVVEAASKTGISSLIGQTEGTLFVECAAITSEALNKRISLGDGTNNNRVTIAFTTTISAFVVSGGVVSLAGTTGITTPEQKHKIALAYKQNDFAVYIDGALVLSDTSGNTFSGALSQFQFSEPDSSLPFAGTINQAIVFPTRLTNAQLAELTA